MSSALRILATVSAILLLVWSIAVPSFPGAHPPGSHPHESAARATLSLLASAQRDWHARKLLDRDGDGIGEYGWFSQLAAASPPLLSERFAKPTAGRIERGAYVFEIWLPADGEQWLSEAAQQSVDIDGAEQRWLAYAWPRDASLPRRVFCVDATGTIRARNNDGRYAGHARPVPVDAALPSSATDLTVDLGQGERVGRDGARWRVSR